MENDRLPVQEEVLSFRGFDELQADIVASLQEKQEALPPDMDLVDDGHKLFPR